MIFLLLPRPFIPLPKYNYAFLALFQADSRAQLKIALIGASTNLTTIGAALGEWNSIPTVSLSSTVQKAKDIATDVYDENDLTIQASSSSADLQLLKDLGVKYNTVTNDPKNPGALPSDALMVDIVCAYLNLYCTSGWILVDFPKTTLQAKLLEKKWTGYTDPQVEEYLASFTKGAKKRASGNLASCLQSLLLVSIRSTLIYI